MSKRAQAGFTLIELIIVMAISAGLAAMALTGFSTLRGQAQFSDAVERLEQTTLTKRQEALSTIKLSGGGTSCTVKANACDVTFGRLLTFTPGSSTVQVQTLYTQNTSIPLATQPVNVQASETTSYGVAWGVTYAGAKKAQVAFVRSVSDGTLQTAVNIANGWSGPPYAYSDFVPNGAAADLKFVDPSGRVAFLHIDPPSNDVTRRYQ